MNDKEFKDKHQYVGLPTGSFFQTNKIFLHGEFTISDLERWLKILKEVVEKDE